MNDNPHSKVPTPQRKLIDDSIPDFLYRKIRREADSVILTVKLDAHKSGLEMKNELLAFDPETAAHEIQIFISNLVQQMKDQPRALYYHLNRTLAEYTTVNLKPNIQEVEFTRTISHPLEEKLAERYKPEAYKMRFTPLRTTCIRYVWMEETRIMAISPVRGNL